MTYGTAGRQTIYVRKRDTQTIDSNAETTQDADLNLDNTTTGQAQSFTATNSAVLTSCKFYLKENGTATGNAVAKLYAHTGVYGTSSKPTGSALATSANVDVSAIGTSYTLVTFSFTGAQRYPMVAGTKYCIAIEYTGTAANYVKAGADTNEVTPHGGNSAYYASAAWTADAAKDMCFYVYGIEEKDISVYHYEHNIEQRENNLWTFGLKLVGITTADKASWIIENNEILIFWGTTLRMKGRIEKIAYDNYEVCTIEGVGMAVKLRDRDIDTEYLNTDTDDINTGIVGSLMTLDTNTNYGRISMHFESDNRLRALAGTAQAVDYDWFEGDKTGDQFTGYYSTDNYITDQINVDDFMGDPTATKMTFASSGASQNMHLVSEEIDTYETTNYVTVLGMGDGINQLKAISYNATDNRTTLSKSLDAILFSACVAESGASKYIYVYDLSGFDVADTISVGGEVMTISALAVAPEIDGSWKITVTRPAGAQAHAAGTEVIKTTGKVYCTDSTDLPASGNVWVGQEKISYSAKGAGYLTMDTRGVAYMHSRIVKPYAHFKNAEVWDATYSDSSPEAGSYIAVDGIRSRTFTDTSIISQDLLDYIAQRIRVDREDDVAMIKIESSDAYDTLVTNGLWTGHWVELSDTYTGFSAGTRYEVVGMIYGFSVDRGEYCEVEISNYNATLLENTVKETDNLGKYYKGATNVYQVNEVSDCDGSYITITTCESVDSWITSYPTSVTISLEGTIKQEGNYSIKVACADSLAAPRVAAVYNFSPKNISRGTTLKFWARSSVALSASDWGVCLFDEFGVKTFYNLPAMSANTWYEIEIDITGDEDFITGFGVRQIVDKGALNFYLDNIRVIYPTASLESSFYIPPDAVAINKVLLSYNLSKYRLAGKSAGIATSEVSAGTDATSDTVIDATAGWTTVGSAIDVPDIPTSGFFMWGRIDNNIDSDADVEIRVYNQTDDSYLPDNDGSTSQGYDVQIPSSSDQTYETNFFLYFPGNFTGKTLYLQALCNDSDVTNIDIYTRSFFFTSHVHDVEYGVFFGPDVWDTTDIQIWVDPGDGTYVDKTSDIETAIGHTLAYTENGKEQDIDITSYVGYNAGWKGVKIVTDGKCRISSNVFIQTFIKSTT